MNKTELIEKVAGEVEVSKATAQKMVESVLSSIEAALGSGESVSLIGFGTFSVNERAARTGRNPQTGKKIAIPAKNLVKFKPGKGLKEQVA